MKSAEDREARQSHEPSSSSQSLPRLPARGQYSESARLERLAFLREFSGTPLAEMQETSFEAAKLAGNVENMIGSVEIPLGVAGPLLFRGEHARGSYFLPFATSEGTIVASTSRGALVMSLSGGVVTRVLRKFMLRVPMFELEDLPSAMRFSQWLEDSFGDIREQFERASNHTKLVSLEPYVLGRLVHVRFVFETGDASGQNMGTTCTWYACQWILKQLDRIGMPARRFYIDGNAGGEKKLTYRTFISGRGTGVIAECLLTRKAVEKVLKTTPESIFELYLASLDGVIQCGAVGHSGNMANLIAGVFLATGQDAACVQESGVAQLTMRLEKEGLYTAMRLPSLVVGTVGGGTHMARQRALLEMMGCYGPGTVRRFAEIIAGFALALDISTLSAVASDHFASAHERLGRDRRGQFLHRDDLTPDFFRDGLRRALGDDSVEPTAVEAIDDVPIGPSIITEMAVRRIAKKKLIGHVPLRVRYDGAGGSGHVDVMVKSKLVDDEVIQAMGGLASALGEPLAGTYARYKRLTGFEGCHVRELVVSEQDDARFRKHAPRLYGTRQDDERESYVLVTELVRDAELMDTINDPGGWHTEHIAAALRGIAEVHAIWYGREDELRQQPWLGHTWTAAGMEEASALWQAMLGHAAGENPAWFSGDDLALHERLIDSLPTWWHQIESMPRTLVHNDFHPNNIALRRVGGELQLCAYDWEMATLHLPQHDLAELLCFVLTPDAAPELVTELVEIHRRALQEASGQDIDPEAWRTGYDLCLRDLAVNRMGMYLMTNTLWKHAFLERALRTLRHLIRLEEARA